MDRRGHCTLLSTVQVTVVEAQAGAQAAPGNLCPVFPASCLACYQEPVVSTPKPDCAGYRCSCNYTVYSKIASTYEICV